VEILTTQESVEDKLKISFSDSLIIGKSSKARVKNIGSRIVKINSFFHEYLSGYNIPTAYAFTEGENTLVLDHYDPLNFHVKIQNIAGKRISKIFGVREFSEITIPLYEFFLDDEEKFVLSENHLNSFLLLTNEEYKMILRISSKVNAVLKSFFERRGFVLATVNLKYGRLKNGKIVSTGDYSPFSIKVIDVKGTNDKNFAFNLKSGTALSHYTDLLTQLIIINDKV